MSETENPLDNLIHQLRERAKELNCMYGVQELLSTPEITIEEVCQGIIQALPPGWQYPDVCGAQIIYGGKTYQTPIFEESPWVQSATIYIQDQEVGKISVCYTEERPASDEGPFLKEERKLINTIADQFGFYLLHQQLRQVFQEQSEVEERKSDWGVILDMLKRTDSGLLMRISSKMVNYLYWHEVKEAEELLKLISPVFHEDNEAFTSNQPNQQRSATRYLQLPASTCLKMRSWKTSNAGLKKTVQHSWSTCWLTLALH
jgi:pyruvate,water dikinase